MNNQTQTKANNEPLWNGLEDDIINRISGAIEEVNSIRSLEKLEEDKRTAGNVLAELSSMINLDLKDLDQSVLDGLGPILSNFRELRGNPLGLQDLRQRVERDILAHQKAVEARKGTVYNLVRLLRTDGTVQAPKLTTSNAQSKALPTGMNYGNIGQVEILQFKGLQKSIDITGYSNERDAIAALHNPASHDVVFQGKDLGEGERVNHKKRGTQVQEPTAFWSKLGLVDYDVPEGWVVIGLFSKSNKLRMSVPVEVKNIITTNTSIFARQRPEEGDSIKYLNVVLSDRARVDSAIESKSTKWTAKLGSVFAKKK